MRSFLFLAMRFIIELTIANAAVSLLIYFVEVPEALKTGKWYYLLISVLTIFLLFPPVSFSERLLVYARGEPKPRDRQWPNLILGALNFLGGLPYMISWADPAASQAVVGIPNTPFIQYPLFIVVGGLYAWTGTSFLQFQPYAKLLGFISTAVGLCLGVWNGLIHRNDWLEHFMARMSATGQEMSLEHANTMVTLGIWFMFIFVVIQLWLINLSRQRYTPV